MGRARPSTRVAVRIAAVVDAPRTAAAARRIVEQVLAALAPEPVAAKSTLLALGVRGRGDAGITGP
jgi:hypothetical protein